jgi:hypothetical protein
MRRPTLTRDVTLSCDRKGAESERGFALLIIFVLAASIALMLFMQMPRVAFESERDKEQLLIDRGEQYKRAIQLFYTENRRFPGRLEDLENTNNRRYLRRRYLDPYTGKDEWRLVHTNGMFLTDSLVQKPPANPANQQGGTLTAGLPGTPNPLQNTSGSTPTPPNAASANPTTPATPQPVNAAVLARPSDRPIAPTNGAFASSFNPVPSPVNSGYVDPASYPPITLFPNGYNAPNQQPGQVVQGGIQPGGQFQPGIQPGGQFQPGVQPGFPQPNQFPQGGQFQPGQFVPGVVQPGQTQPVVQPLPFNQFPNPNDPNSNSNFQPGVQQPFPGQQFPVQQFPGQPQTIQPQPIQQPFQQGGAPLPGLNPNFANQFPQQAPNPVLPGQPAPNDTFNNTNANQPPQQFPVPPAQFPPAQSPINQLANNPQAAAGAPAPPNQALNLINQILTTPRQPPPGIGPAGNATQGNQAVGGGIAGVASTYEGPTIKTYAEKAKFQEWEFVFQLQQQQAGIPGANANPLQNGSQQNTGANPTGNPTGANPFGNATPGAPGAPGTNQLFTPPAPFK